ncbi:MAG: putative molybdenum carrier protein [Pseudomonadota bacterium]
MKSIAQMAKTLDISSSTIREYLSRFEEFFPDPVEHEGVKEYPPEAEDLIKKIYGYYQNSGMTKEEIRVKLGGPAPADPITAGAGSVSMSPMDMGMMKELTEKFDHLIATIENLTAAITGASVETFKGIRKQVGSHQKINELSDKLTNMIELTKDEGEAGENIEKNVLETDGTVIFSFGKLTPSALDSINFAKAHKKPWLHIDLETEKNPSKMLRKWMPQFNIKVLNVAGRSASKIPGLKRSIDDIISLVLNE